MEILVLFIFVGKLVVFWVWCLYFGDIYELSVSCYKFLILLKWIYYRVIVLYFSLFVKCC